MAELAMPFARDGVSEAPVVGRVAPEIRLRKKARASNRGDLNAYAPETFTMDATLPWANMREFCASFVHFDAATALSTYRAADRAWTKVTFSELAREIDKRARYLIGLGLAPQESRIALVGEPHPDWIIWAFATMRSGIVLVPLDARATAMEIAGMLEHSEADLVIHSALSSPLIDEALALIAGEQLPSLSFDQSQDLPELRDVVLTDAQIEDTAVITYTSGTFSNPKAVMTSYRALLFQTAVNNRISDDIQGTTYLSHLPQHHLFEFICTFFSFSRGCQTILCDRIDKETLGFYFQNCEIDRLNTVPLLLEVLETSMRSRIAERSLPVRMLMAVLFTLAKLPLPRTLRRRVFAQFHRGLGTRMYRIVVGGAALQPQTLELFESIGISVHQGYGLTETGPVISAQRIGDTRPGTVGPPIPGIEVRIAQRDEDGMGEIRTRGAHVFKGYFKAPDLTREAFDSEGFFRTGDLGYIDAHGHLCIRGRQKRLIVLPSGKKIHAEEVESVASQLPFVLQACALPMKQLRGAALEGVVLAVSVTPQWLASVDPATMEQTAKDLLMPVLRSLSPYKRPAEIFILAEKMPTTPTQKVMPNRVVALLRERIQKAA